MMRRITKTRKNQLTGAPCGPIRPLSPGIPLGPLKREQKAHHLGAHHGRITKSGKHSSLDFSPIVERTRATPSSSSLQFTLKKKKKNYLTFPLLQISFALQQLLFSNFLLSFLYLLLTIT